MKSPVAVAYGSAALLLKRRQQLPEPDVEQLILFIYEASEQTTRLIDDLLALARTEAGAVVQLEPLSGRVVQASVDSFLRSRPTRKVLLTLPDPAPVFLADQTYLEQILQNLLSNADKYSPPVEPVEVLIASNGVEVSIAIRDHGPGVAPDELRKMFDSFYRSQRTAAQAPGKGLGLTVCKRLVEAMGGSIGASLPPGGGLEVSFILREAASE